jgi:hypothetical protein
MPDSPIVTYTVQRLASGVLVWNVQVQATGSAPLPRETLEAAKAYLDTLCGEARLAPASAPPAALNAKGRKLLDWLTANPEAHARDMWAHAKPSPGTVEWLVAHGYARWNDAHDRLLVA